MTLEHHHFYVLGSGDPAPVLQNLPQLTPQGGTGQQYRVWSW